MTLRFQQDDAKPSMRTRLDGFIADHLNLFEQLVPIFEHNGGWSFFVADLDGKIAWPVDPVGVGYPDVDQIMGYLSCPSDWLFKPVCSTDCRSLAFIGVRAESTESLDSLLDSHALFLGRLLEQEQELDDMANELALTYDQLVTMFQVSETTRSNLDLAQVLQSVLGLAVRLSQVRYGFLAFEHLGELHYVTQGWPVEQEYELIDILYQGVKRWGHPIVANSPSNLTDLVPGVKWINGRSLVAPISIGKEIVAAIGLLDKTVDFTAGDRKLLNALTEEIGGIIERHRLQSQLVAQERMRRELEIAAEIQTGLLPTELPRISGLDIAAHSRPASEVGGDFYDFMFGLNDTLVFAFGDVTGKGVPAALFVTVAHTILHSNVRRSPMPRDLLEQINTAMYESLTQSAMFVTLFLGHYNQSNGQFMYANAGHSPVLYYDASVGHCTLLEADGPPVGVLDSVLSTNMMLDLQSGDILLVMSDGFNEMSNTGGEIMGIEPLMQLVEKHASSSAEEIQALFFRQANAFAKSAVQEDDLTICVFKRSG